MMINKKMMINIIIRDRSAKIITDVVSFGFTLIPVKEIRNKIIIKKIIVDATHQAMYNYKYNKKFLQ